MLVDTVNIPSRLGRGSCFTVISRVIEVKVQVGDQPTLPYGSEQVLKAQFADGRRKRAPRQDSAASSDRLRGHSFAHQHSIILVQKEGKVENGRWEPQPVPVVQHGIMGDSLIEPFQVQQQCRPMTLLHLEDFRLESSFKCHVKRGQSLTGSIPGVGFNKSIHPLLE